MIDESHPPDNYCPLCMGLLKGGKASDSITGWICRCVCGLDPASIASDSQSISHSDHCSMYGYPISPKEGGSLTHWLFKEDHQCENTGFQGSCERANDRQASAEVSLSACDSSFDSSENQSNLPIVENLDGSNVIEDDPELACEAQTDSINAAYPTGSKPYYKNDSKKEAVSIAFGLAACSSIMILLVVAAASIISSSQPTTLQLSDSLDKLWISARSTKNLDRSCLLYDKAIQLSGKQTDVLKQTKLLLEYSELLLHHNRLAKAQAAISKAKVLCQQACKSNELNRETHRAMKRQLAQACFIEGMCFNALRQFEKAEEQFSAALTLSDNALGDIVFRDSVNSQYVDLLKKQGKIPEAKRRELELYGSVTTVSQIKELGDKALRLVRERRNDEARQAIELELFAARKFGTRSHAFIDAQSHQVMVEILNRNFSRAQVLLQSMIPQAEGVRLSRSKVLLAYCLDEKSDNMSSKKLKKLYLQAAASQPNVFFETLHSLACSFESLPDHKRAMLLRERTLQIGRRQHLEEEPLYSTHLEFLSRLYLDANLVEKRVNSLHEMLSLMQRQKNPSLMLFMSSVGQLSDHYSKRERNDKEIHFLEEVSLPNNFSKNERQLARTFINTRLCWSYQRTHRMTLAHDAFQKVIVDMRASSPRSKMHVPALYALSVDMANMYSSKQNWKEERHILQQCIDLAKELGETPSPALAARLDRTINDCKQEESDKPNSNSPFVYSSRRFNQALELSKVSIQRRDLEKAETQLEEAACEYEKCKTKDSGIVYDLLSRQGDLAGGRGKLLEALSLYRQQLRLASEHEQILGAQKLDQSLHRVVNIADAFALTGLEKEAIECFRLAEEACSRRSTEIEDSQLTYEMNVWRDRFQRIVEFNHKKGDNRNARVFEGKWSFDANGYSGVLDISRESNSTPVVRIRFDNLKLWETTKHAKIDPHKNGEISFSRLLITSGGNRTFQRYKGRLLDGMMVGSFTTDNLPDTPISRWLAWK